VKQEQLRENIFKHWKNPTRGPYHYASMGLMLVTIKEEKLAQVWGYKNYSHYLVKELGIIPPSIANIWTGIVTKLRDFFDFSAEEILNLEKKVPQQLMAVSLRYAEDRKDLENIWRRANYKQVRWSGIDKQRFIEREARKTAWKDLFFNDQEAKLVEGIVDFFRVRYHLPPGGEKRSRVVLALALVYKGLIERGEEDMGKWLRKELKKFNLPEEIADIEKARFKPPRN
jgi:hypothetical protein